MSKIVSEDIGEFGRHSPKSVAIVTSSSRGKDNAMTAAWHSCVSLKPPLYGVAISPKRFSYQLIAESKEFGINFVPFNKASLAARVGGIPGGEIDKFKRLHIKKEKSLKTGIPILKDAYAAYECKLVDSRTYGDHFWVIGEIVAVHLLEEALTLEGTLDLGKMEPLIYLGADFYATADKNSTIFIRRGI